MQYKIIVDKQPMTSPSNEKKEYIVDIEELRVQGDVYDSLNIEMDRTYVTRRLSLSEYGVLSVLNTPVIEELTDLDIELFEGDNYIYLIDMEGNHFYAEYVVKNDFTNIFPSKAEMNSSINQTAQSIELSVNQKLENYSTTEEMNAAITAKADEINIEVEKKVDDEELTGANITLRINEDTSEATINADKISLEGKNINLTGDDVTISSNNFNVDTSGNVSCSNININSGKIKLNSGTSSNPNFTIGENLFITEDYFSMGDEVLYGDFIAISASTTGTTEINVNSGGQQTRILASEIQTPKIICPDIDQSSLESIKKNISKFNKNATKIINNSDIYEYNLKSDKDTDKKMIGFIIGENYRTPDEVVSRDGQAVGLYSAIGILWKAFQEQSKRIEELEKEVRNG